MADTEISDKLRELSQVDAKLPYAIICNAWGLCYDEGTYTPTRTYFATALYEAIAWYETCETFQTYQYEGLRLAKPAKPNMYPMADILDNWDVGRFADKLAQLSGTEPNMTFSLMVDAWDFLEEIGERRPTRAGFTYALQVVIREYESVSAYTHEDTVYTQKVTF